MRWIGSAIVVVVWCGFFVMKKLKLRVFGIITVEPLLIFSLKKSHHYYHNAPTSQSLAHSSIHPCLPSLEPQFVSLRFVC
jgi:hypothetical protein